MDETAALGRLAKSLQKGGMKLYAVLPEGSPELLAGVTETVLKKAPDAGFVLLPDSLTEARAPEIFSLTEALSGFAGKKVGLVLPPRTGEGALTPETLQKRLPESGVGLLLPRMSGTADHEYADLTAFWQSLANMKVIPFFTGDNTPEEAGYQLFYRTVLKAPAGVVVPGYRAALLDPLPLSRLLSFAGGTAEIYPDLADLSIKKELSVGYPQNGSSTPYGTIVILGSSDPDRPLTLDGREVERPGKSGAFSAEVKLHRGLNIFTLRQGSDTVTVRVRRPYDGDGLITVVTKGSRFPADDMALKPGDSLTFRCVAPSGGRVRAKFGDTEVVMEQKAATAKKGIAAVFEGTYEVPEDFPADELTELGPVTYYLNYLGVRTSYESAGRVFIAGENVTPMVRANTENISVLPDYKDEEHYTGTLHLGARIPTTGAVQHNGTLYYEVEGGYISSARAGLDIGIYPRETTVDRITSEKNGRQTDYTFRCKNFPAVTAERTETELILFFRETEFKVKDLKALEGDHIVSAITAPRGSGTELRLTLAAPDRLWGYDVQYNDEGDAVLTLIAAPVLSDVPGKPLTGITVLVDPGHGYLDPGALGVAGPDNGPNESGVNLAVSLVLRDRLEQLGAEVYMTHETDIPGEPKFVLDQRVRMAVETRPDFFLSVHHNSTGLTKEVEADWMETYYNEDMSLPFAENLQANLKAATGREAAEPEWGYYYVTRLSFCPAVLYEVGFMPNVLQYEDCADWLTVCRTAAAMADAVVDSVPRPAPVLPEE